MRVRSGESRPGFKTYQWEVVGNQGEIGAGKITLWGVRRSRKNPNCL